MNDPGTLFVRIFDGTRALFAAPVNFLVTITDDRQKQYSRDYHHKPALYFEGLPTNTFYSVVVWAQGYRQTGFTPIQVSSATLTILDVMLVADDPGFSFVNARWPQAQAAYPFLGADLTDPAAAAARYDSFMDYEHSKPLACMLNLCQAMSQIELGPGSPLDLMKAVRWDVPALYPAADRFFAWCDPELATRIKARADAGAFAEEKNPGAFHPGATRSWKQIEFGEANVQLTFHENERRTIGGISCVMVEPDIDYYRDLAAHAICEVIPNGLTNSVTDPIEVYVLRWIAGRRASAPEFAPLYTIV